MVRGLRLEVGHNDLDQTKAWQVAGRIAPGADPLWEDPVGALDLAAGYDAVCVDVSWARLEPDYGAHDEAVLDRYRKLLEMAEGRGLMPLVRLGGDSPWWLGEELWLMPGSPERFVDHVRRTVEGLGGRHDRVVLRQPSIVDGWVEGSAPPARRLALSDAWSVADNLVTAHVLAYEAVHELVPGVTVGLGLRPSTCYDWHRLFLDLVWARRLGVCADRLDRWLAGRRREHDRWQPAASPAEWAARRTLAALSPYAGGPQARRVPRRAVDSLFASAHELPVDALALEWTVRHRPWDRTPADADAWCDDQRRLTPGVELWVDGIGPNGSVSLHVDVIRG